MQPIQASVIGVTLNLIWNESVMRLIRYMAQVKLVSGGIGGAVVAVKNLYDFLRLEEALRCTWRVLINGAPAKEGTPLLLPHQSPKSCYVVFMDD